MDNSRVKLKASLGRSFEERSCRYAEHSKNLACNIPSPPEPRDSGDCATKPRKAEIDSALGLIDYSEVRFLGLQILSFVGASFFLRVASVCQEDEDWEERARSLLAQATSAASCFYVVTLHGSLQ